MATLKQLMTILSMQKVTDDERAQLICGWTKGRTTSARELTQFEMDDIVAKLLAAESQNENEWRKRLMASIYGFLRLMNKKASPELVKGIACRAAKVDNFNKIPKQRLITLYATFTHMQKDLNFGRAMLQSFIAEAQCYN